MGKTEIALPVRIKGIKVNTVDEQKQYKVVINHEEQYSLWLADKENALGWSDVGKAGTKEECLEYIDEVWTDMRPLSLRLFMENQNILSDYK